MLRSVAVVLGLIVLSGCGAGSKVEMTVGMPGSSAWFATAAPETIASYFGKRCKAYGHQDNTPAMTQCIQSEVQSKRSSNGVREAAAYNRPVYVPPTSSETRLKTTCYRTGSITQCF